MTIRVLVVDDHPTVRLGLESLIDRQADMSVIGAADDGITGVAAAHARMPDVVVMDVSMPGLNGMEAARRISTELPAVRVLCLSVHSEQRFVSAMLAAGASGYVLKSAAAVELLEAVRVVASGRTYLSPAVASVVVQDYASLLAGASSGGGAQLTGREREVLQLITEGHDTAEIAARLRISAKTVATHRSNIMAKVDLRTVVALTKYAIRQGITTAARDER